ncbi:MAG TPA: ABC transporter ATP-binding protein [Coriobacteriia bacterium]|uniref:ABC transporter ATP-binding protein n=1 Tax=Anaerosoma tenue TaxID=2933588 RepID=UPI00076CE649|nr:ABC transporter ATP-binding protein [Anaerosoma tenue]KUK49186.1 MAG: ABC-type multidrug transport system, ATPase component [Actinobacteria bacterium 66_15]MCK8114709.1 ABC transporter ATP-binding protein [Anaerosoma tenue]HAL31112.1 ABC transporter ATP-binding protein [Coriobacteriia bacterium]
MSEVHDQKNALEVRGLTRAFGVRKALDGVDLDLPERAFLSVFGPNGAGKTTLIKVLTTLLNPTNGTAQVLGMDVVSDAVELRTHIGLISHNPLLYPDLTAEENLLFFADMYGVEQPEARVAELLEAVELDHRKLDLTRTFSRGMLQRLSIARALLHRPEVLFLDEPYSGLDPHAMDILDGLIAQIRGNHTFVMISHDLDKGLELCSHALILAKGRVVMFERREDIDDAAFRQTYRSTVGMGVS